MTGTLDSLYLNCIHSETSQTCMQTFQNILPQLAIDTSSLKTAYSEAATACSEAFEHVSPLLDKKFLYEKLSENATSFKGQLVANATGIGILAGSALALYAAYEYNKAVTSSKSEDPKVAIEEEVLEPEVQAQVLPSSPAETQAPAPTSAMSLKNTEEPAPVEAPAQPPLFDMKRIKEDKSKLIETQNSLSFLKIQLFNTLIKGQIRSIEENQTISPEVNLSFQRQKAEGWKKFVNLHAEFTQTAEDLSKSSFKTESKKNQACEFYQEAIKELKQMMDEKILPSSILKQLGKLETAYKELNNLKFEYSSIKNEKEFSSFMEKLGTLKGLVKEETDSLRNTLNSSSFPKISNERTGLNKLLGSYEYLEMQLNRDFAPISFETEKKPDLTPPPATLPPPAPIALAKPPTRVEAPKARETLPTPAKEEPKPAKSFLDRSLESFFSLTRSITSFFSSIWRSIWISRA